MSEIKFEPYESKDYKWKNYKVLNKNVESEIRSRYVTPGDRIAFSSPQTIYEDYNKQIPLSKIKNILTSIESYTLHRQYHEGQRNISYSRFRRYQFQMDLCFILDGAEFNDGVKYLLTVIDTFTRYAFARPIKTKNAEEVLSAFKDVLSEAVDYPHTLVCDKGTEFINNTFKKFCDVNKIKLFNPSTQTHAAYIERFNGTIQRLIKSFCTERQTQRYIDHLQDIVKTYNTRQHRMIGMSPLEAETNPAANEIINNMISRNEKNYKKQIPKFNIGDTVRISKTKDKFSRGYNQQSQYEVFKIFSIDASKNIPLYHLTSYDGKEEIEGGFYGFELTPTNLDVFKIEKILRKKTVKGKKYVYVKWLGYGNEANEWIPEEDVQDI